MKQVAQRPRDGVVSVVDVPLPALRPGYTLVAARFSLISAGTERRKVQLGGQNLLQKARSRPDLARKVVDRARVEGVRSAVGVARERLQTLDPLGYSAAGVVIRVGPGVEGIAPGDSVACGGEWANHAEVLAVPRNLLAKVPDGVDLADAAYATVGSIALHGLRQAEATVGETVGVVGLGLVGQLAVRLLLAAGCRPIGIDLDEAAVEMARKAGATAFRRDEPALETKVRTASAGIGLDAVLICAATSSSDPLELAARIARDRGRLVLVGDVPIVADRALLYEKELQLRLSRSYGPGRYDREYEDRGRDLPPSYVRWTEQRNMQAFLDLVAAKRVAPGDLTTHRFPVEEAQEAYRVLTSPNGGRAFGVLLEYPEELPSPPVRRSGRRSSAPKPGVGLIGAGAFARSTLIPALQSAGAQLVAVTSERGLTAADVAARFGFERAASSADEILEDPAVGAVVIATRHPSHAALTSAALHAGKAVFVEKPLALSYDHLQEVESALSADSILMVGFNRRYAPLVGQLEAELGSRDDLVLSMRVNAGSLAADHWLHDPEDGGGRLLGEGCHFVDLLAALSDSPAVTAHAFAVPQPGRGIECSDSFSAHIRFARSVGTLVYSGGGDGKLPKERLEVMGGGIAAVLDDFRRLTVYRGGKRRIWKSAQDKGHRGEIAHFLAVVKGEVAPPHVQSYLDSTRITLALAESLRTGEPVDISTASADGQAPEAVDV